MATPSAARGTQPAGSQGNISSRRRQAGLAGRRRAACTTRAVKLVETVALGSRRSNPFKAASSSQDSCHSGWAASQFPQPVRSAAVKGRRQLASLRF
jgi:hypothetical protein